MKHFSAILRREFASIFLSPIAYVTMVVFLILTGLTFMVKVVDAAGSGGDAVPLQTLLVESVVVWVTLLISVISMRLFSEEKRAGTIETLMTAPVTESSIVLGKYVGGLIFLWLMILPSGLCLWILKWMCPDVGRIDVGGLVGGSIILLALTAFCMAIGLLASILTRNQIIAAASAFCMIWLFLLAGWFLAALPIGLSSFADYINVQNHIEMFSLGSVDTRPVLLYASATSWLLFIAIRILESSRWR